MIKIEIETNIAIEIQTGVVRARFELGSPSVSMSNFMKMSLSCLSSSRLGQTPDSERGFGVTANAWYIIYCRDYSDKYQVEP